MKATTNALNRNIERDLLPQIRKENITALFREKGKKENSSLISGGGKK